MSLKACHISNRYVQQKLLLVGELMCCKAVTQQTHVLPTTSRKEVGPSTWSSHCLTEMISLQHLEALFSRHVPFLLPVRVSGNCHSFGFVFFFLINTYKFVTSAIVEFFCDHLSDFYFLDDHLVIISLCPWCNGYRHRK